MHMFAGGGTDYAELVMELVLLRHCTSQTSNTHNASLRGVTKQCPCPSLETPMLCIHDGRRIVQ